MTQTQQDTIVLDSFGNIDIAYYEAEAQRLRSQIICSGLSSAARFVFTRIAKLIKAVRQWTEDSSHTASRTA